MLKTALSTGKNNFKKDMKKIGIPNIFKVPHEFWSSCKERAFFKNIVTIDEVTYTVYLDFPFEYGYEIKRSMTISEILNYFNDTIYDEKGLKENHDDDQKNFYRDIECGTTIDIEMNGTDIQIDISESN